MSFVRRIVSSLVFLAFAATLLHASVPATVSPEKLNQSSGLRLDTLNSQAKQNLALTAAPADRRSFYLEFYPESLPAKAQPESGLLHWFTSAVKKTAHRVIPN